MDSIDGEAKDYGISLHVNKGHFDSNNNWYMQEINGKEEKQQK